MNKPERRVSAVPGWVIARASVVVTVPATTVIAPLLTSSPRSKVEDELDGEQLPVRRGVTGSRAITAPVPSPSGSVMGASARGRLDRPRR